MDWDSFWYVRMALETIHWSSGTQEPLLCGTQMVWPHRVAGGRLPWKWDLSSTGCSTSDLGRCSYSSFSFSYRYARMVSRRNHHSSIVSAPLMADSASC